MSSQKLLILESPNKITKVQGYVGDAYLVSASKGHIRSLGKVNELGIDIENNFTPSFEITEAKYPVVNKMKREIKQCSKNLIIATDFDREGEAIGWHVCQVLGIDVNCAPRLIFKEITKKGLTDALSNPSKLDMNMVYSQQARMVLDKLIGFKLCSIIHRYFKNWKLSAGRVQSVVSKLIIEREDEIALFKKSNYFKGKFGFVVDEKKRKNKTGDFVAVLSNELTDVNEASNIIQNINDNNVKFYVSSKKVNKSTRKPQVPFTTSSLQQEASVRFGMSPKVCMSVAQKLYEAGTITYMRTDSLMLSDKILKDCENYIKTTYGAEYHKRTIYNKKKSKGAQEAHEACRPVDIKKLSVLDVPKLGAHENKLYQLIWRRTVASQMTPANVETRTIKIEMDDTESKPRLSTFGTDEAYELITKFEKILFDGFLKVYERSKKNIDGEEEDTEQQATVRLEHLYTKLKKGDEVWCNNVNIEEQETKSPMARYTEASLVKQLEKLGIGRPSTYASMIDKVQARNYVSKQNISGVMKDFYTLNFQFPDNIKIDKKEKKTGAEKNKLLPTPLGRMITEYLEEHFDRIMNYDFTSSVELQLDEIANGKLTWNAVVAGVYEYMVPTMNKILAELAALKGGGGTLDTNRKRLLGVNPGTKLEVYVIKTKNGWAICEEHTNKKKSRWGNFNDIPGISHKNVTLEDALKTLRFPYILGKYKSKPVQICKGKNVYIKFNDTNISIENYNCHKKSLGEQEIEVNEITIDEAKAVIDYYETTMKESAMLSKKCYEFEGNKDIIIKNGRYGYYIRYLSMYNIPLPKNFKKDITELNEETVLTTISKFLKKQNK